MALSGVSGSGVSGAAAIASIVLAAVIVFMDWVPTPLNRNIETMSQRERLPSSLIHGGAGAVFALANLGGWRWVILAGAVWFTVVLGAAIRNWWAPYLFGARPAEISVEMFQTTYARNLRLAPTLPGRPITPDLQHCLIHLALLASVVLNWASFAAA
jgi:hypothetical protein